MSLWCLAPGCDDLMSVAFARPLPGSPTHTRLEACACLDLQVWHFLALLVMCLEEQRPTRKPKRDEPRSGPIPAWVYESPELEYPEAIAFLFERYSVFISFPCARSISGTIKPACHATTCRHCCQSWLTRELRRCLCGWWCPQWWLWRCYQRYG